MRSNGYKLCFFGAFFAMAIPAQSMVINIVAGAALAGNVPALNAFNRAANQWTNRFSDPIVVTINANLAVLGAGVIGSTNAQFLQDSYTNVRNSMVNDEAAEANAAAVVGFLPTAGQFSGTLPIGFSFTGLMYATKANFKALGYANIDLNFGLSDGNITFNSNFAFDFDNSDGVTAGQMDFETVAAHEIGHLLGFISAVDDTDVGAPRAISFAPLDMYRFGPTANPNSNATFTSSARNFVPGAAAFFDDLSNEWLFSTGVNGGDGRQASHWKDNDLTANLLGIMDPTLAFGQTINISAVDERAFDLIGYNYAPVPEPATLAAVGLGAIALLRRRKA